MGVDLETWRGRIGGFLSPPGYHGTGKQTKRSTSASSKVTITLRLLLFLSLTLILSGDIELNPGPKDEKPNSLWSPLLIAAKQGNVNDIRGLLSRGDDTNAVTENEQTVLHIAAWYNTFEIVTLLLDNGADVHARDMYGYTPLHYAAKYNTIQVIDALVKLGSDLDAKTKSKQTVLHLAAWNNTERVVTCLISDHRADLHARDKLDYTPLHYAAMYNTPEVLIVLLTYGSISSLKTKYNQTTLHLAAWYNSVAMVNVLIQQKEDIEACDEDEYTPLHYASQYNTHEVVSTLLDHGSNPHAVTKNRDTILHLAARYNRPDVLTCLLNVHGMDIHSENKFQHTPLHLAAWENSLDVIQLLVEAGADVSKRDKYLFTPLHYVSRRYSKEALRKYLDRAQEFRAKTKCYHKVFKYNFWDSGYGIIDSNEMNESHNAVVYLYVADNDDYNVIVLVHSERDTETRQKYTPVHYAARYNLTEVVDVLLKWGAKCNDISKYDGTPLLYASEFSSTTVVNTLINHGADITSKNKHLQTILHLAAMFNTVDVLNCILRQSEFINSLDKDSATPLHYACMKNSTDVIHTLLQHGAKLDAKNNNEDTLLHLASCNNSVDVVTSLIDKGLDIFAVNKIEDTMLHLAAWNNSVDVVTSLIDKGMDIFAVNKNLATPLHYSCEKNSREVVDVLLENGADINARTKYNQSVLHLAASGNTEAMAMSLIRKGQDVHAVDERGWTPLHYACHCSSLEVVNLLIQRGADLIATTNNDETVLHLATWNNSIDVVTSLIDRGQDIHGVSKSSWTPLHYACHYNSLEVVNLLIQRGADLSATTNSRWTPLHYACHYNSLEVVNLLIQRGADLSATTNNSGTVLHHAAWNNSVDVVTSLIDRGQDIHAVNKNNWTPLYYACRYNSAEVVNALIQCGADLNARIEDRATMLHIGACYNSADVVTLLINKGLDILAVDKDLRTPLNYACAYNIPDVVSTLLQHGADLNAKTKNNETVLHDAAWNGTADMVTFLLDKGLNVSAVGKDLVPPLHYSCKCNSLEIVDVLLDHGADINARTKYNQTVLHLAAWTNTEAMVMSLIHKGQDIHAVDEDLLTPLHYACQYNSDDVVRALLHRGADCRAKTKANRTPLWYAISEGKCKSVRTLIEYAASVNLFSQGMSPLATCIEKFKRCQDQEENCSFIVKMFYLLREGIHVTTSVYKALENVEDIGKIIVERGTGDLDIVDILDSDVTEFSGENRLSLMVLGHNSALEKISNELKKKEQAIVFETVILTNVKASTTLRMRVSNSLFMSNIKYFNQASVISWLMPTVTRLSISRCDIVFPWDIDFPGDMDFLSITHSNTYRGLFGPKPRNVISIKCKSLKKLYLNSNNLIKLQEDIGAIPGLNTLVVNYNSITKVPLSIARMSNYRMLNLQNNPITNVPRTLTEGDEIISYLKAFLDNETVRNDKVKVVLVGKEGSGKTSLVKALANTSEKVEKTDGISCSQVKLAGSNVTLTVYDFAGDVDFLESHALFMTNHTLYLVVFDLSKCVMGTLGTDYNLQQEMGRVVLWLQTIHAHAPNARVIMVGTHADNTLLSERELSSIWKGVERLLVKCAKNHREYHGSNTLDTCFLCCTFELERKAISKGVAGAVNIVKDKERAPLEEEELFMFPHIVGYFEVSSTVKFPKGTSLFSSTNRSIQQLAEAIKDTINGLISDTYPTIPQTWHEFRNMLEERRKVQKSYPILSMTEYRRIASVFDSTSDFLRNVTSFLSTQGDILNLQPSNPANDTITVLDCQWLADQLRVLISFNSHWVDNNGLLTMESFTESFAHINVAHHDAILTLFLDSRLCIQCSSQEQTASGSGEMLLFPCRLLLGQPSIDNWTPSPKSNENQVSYLYHFNFIPPKLFSEMIANIYNYNHQRFFVGPPPIFLANNIVYGSTEDIIPCERHQGTLQSSESQVQHYIRIELLFHCNGILITVRGKYPCCFLQNVENILPAVFREYIDHRLSLTSGDSIDIHSGVQLKGNPSLVCSYCTIYRKASLGRMNKHESKYQCSRYHDHRFNDWEDMLACKDVEPVSQIAMSVIRALDEKACPKLFFILPIKPACTDIIDQVLSLVRDGYAVHLLCEYPGGVHFTGNSFKISTVSEFVKKYGPHIQKVLWVLHKLSKVLSTVTNPVQPLVGAAMGAAPGVIQSASDVLNDLMKQSKLRYPNVTTYMPAQRNQTLDQFLREDHHLSRQHLTRYLHMVDETYTFGDLYPIEDGRQVYWLCQDHARVYDQRK